MTAYDDWKTTKQEIDDEAWEDAVDQVAHGLADSYHEEVVGTLAAADDVLNWLCHAVVVPQTHLQAFRDLIKVASGLRESVEAEMKKNRMIPDAD